MDEYPWPPELPADLVTYLEGILKSDHFHQHRGTKSKPRRTDSQRNKDAKKIQSKARELRRLLTDFWEENLDVFLLENHEDKAMELANEWLTMDERKTNLFRAGFDPFSAQYLLHGIVHYMDAIIRPGKPGKPMGYIELWLVERVASALTRKGFDLSSDPNNIFNRTLEAAFSRLGWKSPEHHLKQYLKAKKEDPDYGVCLVTITHTKKAG